ncbi:MAG: MaoC family dehydratase [Betaproteobacteria bacterium]
MRPLSGYFFEDYRLGQKFVHAIPRTITQGDVSLYQALTGSRSPLHCSEPFAQSLGYPSMPVDDLLVFHIAFGKTVPDVSYNAVANLGYADCRFIQPVYIGDTLRAESEVIGFRGNSSGKTGVVHVRSNCFNQRNELVLTWIRWVMVNRRDAVQSPDTEMHGVKDVPPLVEMKDFSIPAFLKPAALRTEDTGGERFWDDYQTKELIHHPAGITIDETDHTLATRLYQNTARVHFDLHHMKSSRFGRRLVYGGQVISLCRALAFDGLENALGLLAINSGSHTNPTFAGDTLYASSTIEKKWAISPALGAMAIDLRGFKNFDPAQNKLAPPEESSVLSLNYTVLMPRR